MRVLEQVLRFEVHVEVRRHAMILRHCFDEELSKFGAWEAFFVHDVPIIFLSRNITHLPLYAPKKIMPKPLNDPLFYPLRSVTRGG